MRYLLIIMLSLYSLAIFSQEIIDGNFAFQDDPAKKYSILVPSSYNPNTPHALMIGFHPLNTNRWDAQSWRDTLINFAESNQLILACPDGGPDGRVDDPIDTAFTSVLLDSLGMWYNIDRNQQYAIGFSWGARTAYTYTFNHPDQFKGVIPIGAAIEGTNQFPTNIESSQGTDFYIVHGSNDSPSERYFPALGALDEAEICHSEILISGVGHTIDFPNRNSILDEAFAFVSQSNNCQISSTSKSVENLSSLIDIYPNPTLNGHINIEDSLGREISSVQILNLQGQFIQQLSGSDRSWRTKYYDPGVYLIKIYFSDGSHRTKRIIFLDKN